MKDYSRNDIASDAPVPDLGYAMHAIKLTLEALGSDESHLTSDKVVDGLTFKDLIRTLQSAKSSIGMHQEEASGSFEDTEFKYGDIVQCRSSGAHLTVVSRAPILAWRCQKFKGGIVTLSAKEIILKVRG